MMLWSSPVLSVCNHCTLVAFLRIGAEQLRQKEWTDEFASSVHSFFVGPAACPPRSVVFGRSGGKPHGGQVVSDSRSSGVISGGIGQR